MINHESINLRTFNVDSRLRTSGRAEDMQYELQEPVEMPRGAAFWVTSVSLPVVWPNVNNNNQLYVKEYNSLRETLKVVEIPKTTITSAVSLAHSRLLSTHSCLGLSRASPRGRNLEPTQLR